MIIDTHIPAHLDPLRERPPLEIWFVDKPLQIRRMLTKLPNLFTRADIQRLDRYLFDRGHNTQAQRQQLTSDCDIRVVSQRGIQHRIGLDCHYADTSGLSFAMVGEFFVKDGKPVPGRIDLLQTSSGDALLELELRPTALDTDNGHWVARFEPYHKGSDLHARIADGRALELLELRWADPGTDNNHRPQPLAGKRTGNASLSLMDDFRYATDAIDTLVADAGRTGTGVFSNRTFRGTNEMQELFARLGLDPVSWCCGPEQRRLPPMRRDVTAANLLASAANSVTSGRPIRIFERYCATCHRTESSFPPNFLYGDDERVTANLAHCAERIFFRLSMWQRAENERPKSPMPPTSALQAQHASLSEWRQSPQLASLYGYISQTLQLERGQIPRIEDYAARGYENLRHCLGR